MRLSKIESSTFNFGGAKFTIKHLLSGALSEINEKCTKLSIEVSDSETGTEMKRKMEPSLRKEKVLTVQTAVTGWEDVEDENGKPLDCTNENKLLFCDNIDGDLFDDFYKKLTEERIGLAELVKSQREKKVKN